ANQLPQPQQPSEALVRAARVERISSLLMAGFSIQSGKHCAATWSWVQQLYTTPADVQPQRPRIFFATVFFFATHRSYPGGMFTQSVALTAGSSSLDHLAAGSRTIRMSVSNRRVVTDMRAFRKSLTDSSPDVRLWIAVLVATLLSAPDRLSAKET